MAVIVWYSTVYYYLAIIIHMTTSVLCHGVRRGRDRMVQHRLLLFNYYYTYDNFYITGVVVAVIVWYSTVYYYLAIIIHMTTSVSRGSSWP